MFEKIKLPEWKPDYGPAKNSIKSGATVIGARDFLIAYNINLNTSSVETANIIAGEIRESGYLKKEGDTASGKIIRDENGNPIKIPGTLKSLKAIGWYIKEYNCAQVSMNLTNINITPIHIAFDEVGKKAIKHGVKVTGSELIGLIPLKAMLSAGKYYAEKENLSKNKSEQELITKAIKSMKLDELSAFDPKKRIIEYLL
jgi:glutamate formiminotransferase/formiminotetrahydrofolate cyclodeaminase